jgi:hypothetical protein
VRFSLDLPDLSNNTCTLIEQGNDLLIGVVYLLSAGLQSSCGSGTFWQWLPIELQSKSGMQAQQRRTVITAGVVIINGSPLVVLLRNRRQG